MAKFDLIRQKYLSLGVKEDNVDFAIEAVIDGTRREHIIESLTADYRGMTEAQSNVLLEELFMANGGEFKKENSRGYLFAVLLLLIGITGTGFLIAFLLSGGVAVKLKLILVSLSAALFGLIKGGTLLAKSLKGNYRDSDDPFSQ